MKSPVKPEKSRLGTLDVIEFPAPAESPVVVCLHGYGADMADLASLAVELDLKAPARWIFPDAPIAMDMGGRAWFNLDPERLMNLQMGGAPMDLSGDRPAGLDEALKAITGLIEALGVPWERLILGGFSQGAMVALETVLRAPEMPRGLFILSGNLVDEAGVKKLVKARSGLPFFQSHGEQDPLLGYEGAGRLEKILVEAGLKGSLMTFQGGHGLPIEVLVRFASFLDALT